MAVFGSDAGGAGGKIEKRRAARLVCLDGELRVLLFLHADGHGREFWATPGGGLEGNETFEEAARREAAEELGVNHVDLEMLWAGHSEFPFADRWVSQEERFFLVRSHSGIDATAVRETHQREGIRELRWWSVDEIQRSTEPMFPTDLARRLDAYLRMSG